MLSCSIFFSWDRVEIESWDAGVSEVFGETLRRFGVAGFWERDRLGDVNGDGSLRRMIIERMRKETKIPKRNR